MRIGTSIVLVALLAYAIYTAIGTKSEFAIGYYLGIVIRGGCFLLASLKVLTLVMHPPPV